MISTTYTYLITLWRTRSRELAQREAALNAEFRKHLERQQRRRQWRDRALRRKGYAFGTSAASDRFVWAGVSFALGIVVGAILASQSPMLPWVQRSVAGLRTEVSPSADAEPTPQAESTREFLYDPDRTRDRPGTFRD